MRGSHLLDADELALALDHVQVGMHAAAPRVALVAVPQPPQAATSAAPSSRAKRRLPSPSGPAQQVGVPEPRSRACRART